MIFAVVIVAMAYSLWKFRQRGPSDLRDGDPTHGNTLLEIIWTAIPLVIVAIFGIWGAIVLDDNEAIAKGTREITVIGYSFGFDYRYNSDGGFIRNDGLYLPVDGTVTLHMITPLYEPGQREARGHPQLLGAGVGGQAGRDPGRDRRARRHHLGQADAHRDYEVQCTELCGSGHGSMRFKNIHVLTKADFATVSRRAKKEAAEAKEGGADQPGPGGLQDVGLRRLSHVHARQDQPARAGPKLDDLGRELRQCEVGGQE